MNALTACPNADHYQKLLQGVLPPDEVEVLAVHLEQCPPCTQTVASLGSDTLVESLRTVGGAPKDAESKEIERIVERCRSAVTHASAEAATMTGAGKLDSQIPDAEPVDNALGFLAPAQQPDEIGRLDGYCIMKLLGQGGMGMVFEAEDIRLQRRVALKVMKPEIAAKEKHRQRFLREARAAAKVEHDHIVPIYQVGEENGVPFIAMPFLKGEPLDARLKRGRMTVPEIIAVGRQVAEGLAAAHAHGLIHRDIKPGNIWLSYKDEGGRMKDEPATRLGSSFQVKILDFGLARLSSDDAHLTQSGAIIGTPAYMAPEQARGEVVDHRADLFSLGCVLYEMSTGQRAFRGEQTMAVLTSLAIDHPADALSLNPELPPTLAKLIHQLLEKNSALRPASAAVVTESLRILQPDNTVVVVASHAPAVDPWADIDDSSEAAAPVSRDAEALRSGSLSSRDVAPNAPLDRRTTLPGKSAPLHKASASRLTMPRIAIVALLLLLIGGSFAAYQLVFKTKDGTLIVEVDGDADVRFKNGELQIYGEDGKLKYTLKASEKNAKLPPGKYLVKVVGADGVKLETYEFVMEKGGKATVRVRADNVALARTLPKTKAEIMPFFAGTWRSESIVVEPKMPADQARSTGINQFDLVADGKFLRGRGINDDSRFETLLVQSYDDQTDSIRGWFFMSKGEISGPGVGKFDPDKQTLLWMEKLSNGIQAVHQMQFVDANTIKAHLFHQDANNKIVFELRSTFTRLDKPVVNTPMPTDANRPAEMKVLDRALGEWRNEATVRNADNPEKREPIPAHTKARSILGGRFTEAEETNEVNGKKDYWLTSYDTEQKKYRLWFFSSGGEVTDANGHWDETKQTMRWTVPDGTFDGRWTYKSNDLRENAFTVKDKDGKWLFEMEGISKRLDKQMQNLPGSNYALRFDSDHKVVVPLLKLPPAGPVTIEGYLTPSMKGAKKIIHILGAKSCAVYGHESSRWALIWKAHKSVPLALGPNIEDRRTHVAGVVVENQLRLFVDGKLVASRPINTPAVSEILEPFVMGQVWEGVIDEVRVSKIARYDKDFVPENRFQSDKDTLALYHFDEGEGDQLIDSSGNGHHGKIDGARWVKADGSPISPSSVWALAFDSKSRVDLPPSLTVDWLTPFTLEAFVTPTALSGTNINNVLGSQGHTDLNVLPNGKWGFGKGELEAGFSVSSDAPAVLGKKTHVAVVFNRTHIQLYVDGRQALDKEMKDIKLTVMRINRSQFRIGHNNTGINGLVSEVRFSKVARYDKDFKPDNRFEPDKDTLALYHFDEGQGDVLKDSSGNNHHGKIVGAKWVKADNALLPLSAQPPVLAKAPLDAAQARQLQLAWAAYLGVPAEKQIDLPGNVKLTMMLIPPGEFLMGSSQAEQQKAVAATTASGDQYGIKLISSEGPEHRVRIAKPFYMGKFEVTQAQWQAVTGKNPSHFKDNPTNPVENLTFADIQTMLATLNKEHPIAGLKYVLPTEAQWEYACRAGTSSTWFSGNTEEDLRAHGWTFANAGGKSHPVGSLSANAWGLHDMHGNLWERCLDWFEPDYYEKSPEVDPAGAARGKGRVLRGGSWLSFPGFGRSAYRYYHEHDLPFNFVGFRIAMVGELGSELFTPLFNDKDLTGWDTANPRTITWKNDKGTITGVNSGTHPSTGGALFTQKMDYADFHFRCEILAGPSKASPIHFRHNRSFVHGARRGFSLSNPAADTKDAEVRGIGSLSEDVFQVGETLLIRSFVKDHGIKPGTWYRLEIIARGEEIEILVNGKKAIEYQAKSPPNTEGAFGFGCPPGTTVSFRNVEIRDLSANRSAPDPDRRAAEWMLSIGGNVRIIENGKEGNPKALGELPKGAFELRIVDFAQNTKVTDTVLAGLKDCKELTHLFLQGTQVSDAGLSHLKSCKNLNLIHLQKTKVTAAGIAEMKLALPQCKIEWDGGVLEPSRYKNTLGMEFVLVPKGKSWLGGGNGLPGNKEVEFKEDFFLGKYEVTQEEWRIVLGTAPSSFSRLGKDTDSVKGIPDDELKQLPVDSVTWDDCQKFVKRLNEMSKESGWVYRLPTENEWEYACRGGPILKEESGFNYYFATPTNDLLPQLANTNLAKLNRTRKVASYEPNRLGLYDMHGNIAEWCYRSYSAASNDSEFPGLAVLRSGAWVGGGSKGSAAAYRHLSTNVQLTNCNGLRVARVRADNSPRYKNPVGMEFALVPKGKAWLGGGSGKPGNNEVEFKDDFYLGVYEVTQEEWQKVTGVNPSHFSKSGEGRDMVANIAADDLKRFPVENVSWNDVQLFLDALNKKASETGWVYRLPTAAEWEYACRGGETANQFDHSFDFYFDKPTNELLPAQANHAPEIGKGLGRTCPVGSYSPNRLGLHDLHGNVQEWCDDSAKDLDGTMLRVSKGGNWISLPWVGKAVARYVNQPTLRANGHGLRVARVRVSTDSDRRVAEWVLSNGGRVKIIANKLEHEITGVKFLPPGSLVLSQIFLAENQKVTAADLKPLADLKNLTMLSMAGTMADDDAVVAVEQLKSLELLRIEKSKVSADGVKKLAAALPKCRIVSDHGTFGPK